MNVTTNKDGTLSVFIRLSATKGAVFEANSIPHAFRTMVDVVANHCSRTGEHPANIITAAHAAVVLQ